MSKAKYPLNGVVGCHADLVDAAMELHVQGFNVLAVGKNKRAIGKWKPWQKEQQTLAELRQMVESPRAWGIGLILGCPSNHLAVRDFDDRSSFATWRDKNPSLASILPIVETGRGYHVYHFNPGLRTQKFRNGELRGEGSYVVAPPTVHQSGKRYRWANEFSVKNLRYVEASVFASHQFLGAGDNDSDGQARCHRETEDTEGTEVLKPFIDSLGISVAVREAIQLTLPKAEGQRNNLLFVFARRLKGIPEIENATPPMLMNIAREWHRLAAPIIGTKAFDPTWEEFLAAWQQAHTPFGQGILDLAFARARAASLGPTEQTRFDSDYAPMIYKFCRELQRAAGSQPFFLSCPSIEERLSIDRKQAWRCLGRLTAEGTLKVIEKGTRHRATRFHFLDSLEPR